MSQKRARFGLGSQLLALALLGLGAALAQVASGCRPSVSLPLEEFQARPRRSQLPLISVLAPEAAPVLPLVATLRSELALDFDLEVIAVRRDTSLDELRAALDAQKPSAVVLVDNSAVQLYAPLASAAKRPLPAVIVMSSFVERLQQSVPNSLAIAFETPAVTTLSDVRSILARPIARAGLVYREGFESFVARERALALPEKIELVALAVPAEPSVASLGRALRRLEREHLDAMWLSNDNVLLSQKLLSNAWVPFAKKTALPIVVGVPALVQGAVPFGTYAAVPDTVGLGVQTADLIYALQKSGWRAQGPAVQPPVAVKTYLNVALARELGAPPENEKRVDVLLQGGL
jgi:hypothetical protein